MDGDSIMFVSESLRTMSLLFLRFIEQLKVQEHANKRSKKLSGGTKRKVTISEIVISSTWLQKFERGF